MKLRVRLFAVLRERAGTEYLEVQAPDGGLDLAGLKRLVEVAAPELGSLAHVSGVLGTSYVPDDTPIEAGAEVALLPPVSGGSGAEPDYAAGVFELSAEPIDVAALSARVAHESCGALISFCGMTRDRNRGEDVTLLDYEAFDAMAGPEMGRIFERCLAAFGPASAPVDGQPNPELALRMLCVHRTGSVPVGQPSVVIAVASPHRDAAFGAARFLIDELKQSLPVWKKEHYRAGHHWIGDRS